MAHEPIHHLGIQKNKKKLLFVKHLIYQVFSDVSIMPGCEMSTLSPPTPLFSFFLSLSLMVMENPQSPGIEIDSGGTEEQIPASKAPTNKLLLLLLSGHICSDQEGLDSEPAHLISNSHNFSTASC